jgi:Deacetylase PdaC
MDRLKKILLLCCFLPAMVNVFGQTGDEIHQRGWYKMFTGTIGTDSVTLHLHQAGHQYAGYYFYNRYQGPIFIDGEDTSKKGLICFVAYGAGNTNEWIEGSFTTNTFTGTLKSDADSNKVVNREIHVAESIAPISFDVIYTQETRKLMPKLAESPEAGYAAASIWPARGTIPAISDFLKTTIHREFDAGNRKGEIGELFLERKKQLFADYLRDNKNVKAGDLQDMPYAYNLDDRSMLMVVYQNPKLLSTAMYNYSYTGGTHGIYGIYYTCFDLAAKKRLKLTDMIAAPGIKQLPALLEKYFRLQFNLTAGEDVANTGLLETSFKPGNNIAVTGLGMAFNFVPYEMGSFAIGQISIFIPYTELDQWLLPGFRRLVQ